MVAIPEKLEISGVPEHVDSWSVAKIPGFVTAVLARWQREYGELPPRFQMALCPQVEINAMGGLPAQVHELTDPRLTCRHFTGCHKPYVVVIFVGDSADSRRRQVQEFLSWSEGYEVETTDEAIRLKFAGYTEESALADGTQSTTRRFQELLESGELIKILE